MLLRSVFRERVRWAFPHMLVEATEEAVVLYLAPGTAGKIVRRDEDGRYLARWARGDVPDDHVWLGFDTSDFSEAQALGVFTPEEARAVRAEGERVLDEWPFPTGWKDRHPDPSWPIPDSPDDWHVV